MKMISKCVNLLKSLAFLVMSILPIANTVASNDIEIIGYSGRNYVLLRWYPRSYTLYQKCANEGYVVERKTIGVSDKWEQLTIVKPGSYDDFIKISKQQNKALVMCYFLYEKEMMAHSEDIKSLTDSVDTGTELSKKPTEEELQMMYAMGLISCEFNTDLAKVCALNYMDEHVNTQQKYVYRVRPAGNVNAVCSETEVSTFTQTSLKKPSVLQAKNNGPSVKLQWNIAGMQRDYSGYMVEISADGKKFTSITDEPIIKLISSEKDKDLLFITDTLPDCGKDYYYRFCGMSRFGIKGPYSNVVKVRCEDDYSVNVILDRVKINAKGAPLKWTVENPLNQPIKGFQIERMEDVVSDETGHVSLDPINKGRLVSAKKNSFLDKSPKLHNYYRVVAIGPKPHQRAESNIQYAHKIDSVPPVPPTGLQGSIDSAGVVRLSWNPNTDADIYAYRVFFANSIDGQYACITDTFLKVTNFIDTVSLGSLTNDIYYEVCAIDKNYNQSDPSIPLKLLKPDTIPPFKAVFDEVKQHDYDDAIYLSWFNSPSNDVVKVELWQRINANGEWKVLKTWEGESSTLPDNYTDTTSFDGNMVYYNLISYDYSGNHTLTEGVPVYAREKAIECAKEILAVPDYQKGGIKLEWKKCDCPLDKIKIYRRDNGEQHLIGTIGGLERVYFDDKVKKGHTYSYVVLPFMEHRTKAIQTGDIVF